MNAKQQLLQMNATREALYRDLYPSERVWDDLRAGATRLVASAAVDTAEYRDSAPRERLTEVLLAADPDTHRTMIDAMLHAIAIAEPTGYRTEAEALARIRWSLFRALRGKAEDVVSDLIGDRSPILAEIGVELPPEDEGEMVNYDDRGEPVSIGRAP